MDISSDVSELISVMNLYIYICPNLYQCEANDIAFVFLPPNSTHLTQPLDVAVFRPLKKIWRDCLLQFKTSSRYSRTQVLQKQDFPSLLTNMLTKLTPKVSSYLMNGFRKCGLYPLNKEEVLSRLPSEQSTEEAAINARLNASHHLDDSLRDILQDIRDGRDQAGSSEGGSVLPRVTRKKRLAVPPGRSISVADMNINGETLESTDSPLAEDVESVVVDSVVLPECDDHEDEIITFSDLTDYCPGDWLQVQLPNSKRSRHIKYICLVQATQPEIMVKFPRRKPDSRCFTWPQAEDIGPILPENILKKLNEPEFHRGNFTFSLDSYEGFM